MLRILQILWKDLENIFLCKRYRIKKQLTYPSFILPKKRYVHIFQIDGIIAIQDSYILRRSNNSFEDTFNTSDDLITLREDAIEPIDIPNMSLNLIGGKFKEKYLRFIPLMRTDAVESWDGIKRIYLSEFLRQYNESNEFCPVYFHVNRIHGVEFPYQRAKAKELNKILNELGQEPTETNEKYNFRGRTEVVHDPTNLNYWHTEFRLLDFKNDTVPRKSSAWIEEISKQTLTNILCVNAYSTPPTRIKSIPCRFYHKPISAIRQW